MVRLCEIYKTVFDLLICHVCQRFNSSAIFHSGNGSINTNEVEEFLKEFEDKVFLIRNFISLCFFFNLLSSTFWFVNV